MPKGVLFEPENNSDSQNNNPEQKSPNLANPKIVASGDNNKQDTPPLATNSGSENDSENDTKDNSGLTWLLLGGLALIFLPTIFKNK